MVKDIPLYVETFDKWSKLAHVSDWGTWSNGIFARPKASISPTIIADLYELHGWMISMEYRLPNHFPEFQASFEDFRLKLTELLDIFLNYFERSDQECIYWLKKSSALNAGKPKTVDDVVDHSIYHDYADGWVESAMFELTRAGNHIIELVMKDFGQSLERFTNKLVIQYYGGLYGVEGEYCPDLDDEEKTEIYETWLTADRLNAILDKSGTYINPDFVPLMHRFKKKERHLYKIRRAGSFIP